jgi:hypothetical protein
MTHGYTGPCPHCSIPGPFDDPSLPASRPGQPTSIAAGGVRGDAAVLTSARDGAETETSAHVSSPLPPAAARRTGRQSHAGMPASVVPLHSRA